MSGFVYVIRAGTDGPVKIGYSDNPERRREQLQGAHHAELSVMTTFPATRHDEERLHAKAEELDLRIRGEWFTLDQRLEAAIEEARWDAAARVFALQIEASIQETIEATAKRFIQSPEPSLPLDRDDVHKAFTEAADAFLETMEEFRVGALDLAHRHADAIAVTA